MSTMPIIDAFKRYYQQFDQQNMDDLGSLYSTDVVFTDPVHSIKGLDHLKAYFFAMCDNLITCKFEFLGETITEESAWFKWTMSFQHPRIKSGQLLTLTGASYIRFDDARTKIVAHEDFYDMGSMLYEHTPILGAGVRWLKKKLAEA